MTARILRIELRRSAALWIAALTLLSGFAPQVGEGMSSVVAAQREGLLFLVPLALGIGAAQARRDRRSRTEELLATTARPPWQRLLPTATALGAGAVTAHLAAFGGVAVLAVVVGAYVPPILALSAVVTALHLAAGVWLGLAIGRAVPWALVPPLLVVVGTPVMVFLSLVADTEGYVGRIPPAALVLEPSSSIGFDAFESLTTSARLGQLASAAGLAAAGLVLAVAGRHLRLAAIVPVLLGFAVAAALLPSSLYDALTLDRGALALVCTPDEPRVCSRRLHPDLVDDLRGPGRDALALLSAKLPQAPSTVVEASYGNDGPPVEIERRADTLYAEIIPGGSGRAGASEREILWVLLQGAGTPACPNLDPFGRDGAARAVAAAWLLEEVPPARSEDVDALGGTFDPAIARPAYEALIALPPDEQRVRVAELREAELACDGRDRLDILVGGTGGTGGAAS